LSGFRALLVERAGDGVTTRIAALPVDSLPTGDVVVDVTHSSLNSVDARIVTSDTGPVGSFRHIPGYDLAGTGYRAAAATGRPRHESLLRGLGAAEILDRAELETEPVGLMEGERWAAAVDLVGGGGTTLARIVSSLRYGGAVAARGLVGGEVVPVTTAALAIRGVGVLGVNSVFCPAPVRIATWRRLAGLVDAADLAAVTTTIGLVDVPGHSCRMLAGEVVGRVVLDVTG
jgi:acrylyl-CoA reductase (NADPH)